MNDKHLEKFIKEIQDHEGYRDEVYLDPLGNPTCGWGHHLSVGSKVPKRVSEIFLEIDIANAINDFYRIDRKLQDKLNPVRKRVICNMIYNMGLARVYDPKMKKGFKKMWKAIKKEDFDEAHAQMIDSKWCQDVGRRAMELAHLMQTGEDL